VRASFRPEAPKGAIQLRENNLGHALSIRLWLACLATQETLCVYLGIRLGLYEALATGGAANPDELARRAGISPRYAREWLEQQAVAGILRVETPAAGAELRVFSLPEGHREVLCDGDSPLSRVAGILPVGAVAHALPRLLEAYRSGAGLSDRDYGPDWRSGHGAANRSLYAHSLAGWICREMPHVHARLSAGGGRAADIACGGGWAAVSLAQAYPTLGVDGFEIDADLVGDAARNAEQAGVSDRVSFHVHDCSGPGIAPVYDLVCLFDSLHEIPRPVDVLTVCRSACRAGGTVLVMDARVADEFVSPADEIERFQYTTSVLHCLPACLAEQPSAATGTVMRTHVVRRFAREAGFSGVTTLPVDDRFHRLYRLDP
jgi:2-polyprenyl-3-methyl-5-hydroxy-6-metoxy-1,4-benzoquinol methylase